MQGISRLLLYIEASAIVSLDGLMIASALPRAMEGMKSETPVCRWKRSSAEQWGFCRCLKSGMQMKKRGECERDGNHFILERIVVHG